MECLTREHARDRETRHISAGCSARDDDQGSFEGFGGKSMPHEFDAAPTQPPSPHSRLGQVPHKFRDQDISADRHHNLLPLHHLRQHFPSWTASTGAPYTMQVSSSQDDIQLTDQSDEIIWQVINQQ
jgi:hypothetical protein